MIRIGLGTDLHRLEANERPLILGGVDVQSPLGPVSHSDGDCLVHAIIDSLFGSLALGDIGTHFPDTDPRYLNVNSMELLDKCYGKLKNMGYHIVNLDATITLDKPHLKPYIPIIRNNLAHRLGLEADRLSLKAKTSENTASNVVSVIAVCLVEN